MSFNFDHCYRLIKNDQEYKEFEKRGFLLCPNSARHPGRLICQILHFKSPAGDPAYLEFCYRDETLPPDSGDSEVTSDTNGFSLRSPGPLKEAFGKLEKEFSNWSPRLEHRNYDWFRDDSKVLPGWNFLTFDQSPLDGTDIWITEYERRPEWTDEDVEKLRGEREALRRHPNTARQILGFVWNRSDPATLLNMACICQSRVEANCIGLPGGSMVYGLTPDDQDFALFRNKKSDFLAVVLGVESLDAFIQLAAPDEIVLFQGKRTAVLRLGDDAWDILAVESQMQNP